MGGGESIGDFYKYWFKSVTSLFTKKYQIMIERHDICNTLIVFDFNPMYPKFYAMIAAFLMLFVIDIIITRLPDMCTVIGLNDSMTHSFEWSDVAFA